MTDSLLPENPVRATMRAGQAAFGLSVRLARSPDIARVAKATGHDFLFIDVQHSIFNLESIAAIAQTALAIGVSPLVRVRSVEDPDVPLLLDNGVEAVQASEAGVVTPALERIIEANTLLSGLGFESGGLAAAHSIHNGLTTQVETHSFLHGEKVSFGLITQMVLEGRPRADLDEVLAFAMSVRLPVTLAQVGLTDPTPDQIRQIAERSVADGETIHHEPFVVTADAVADSIVAADSLGRGAAPGLPRGGVSSLPR